MWNVGHIKPGIQSFPTYFTSETWACLVKHTAEVPTGTEERHVQIFNCSQSPPATFICLWKYSTGIPTSCWCYMYTCTTSCWWYMCTCTMTCQLLCLHSYSPLHCTCRVSCFFLETCSALDLSSCDGCVASMCSDIT